LKLIPNNPEQLKHMLFELQHVVIQKEVELAEKAIAYQPLLINHCLSTIA